MVREGEMGRRGEEGGEAWYVREGEERGREEGREERGYDSSLSFLLY